MKKDLVLEELVMEEATNLKKYATKKQLSKLNFDTLQGDHVNKCIYGQMTGDCESENALKLIKKCASKVYLAGAYDTFKGELNGSPKMHKVKASSRIEVYVSPIERFLYNYQPHSFTKSTKVKELIEFLKS